MTYSFSTVNTTTNIAASSNQKKLRKENECSITKNTNQPPPTWSPARTDYWLDYTQCFLLLILLLRLLFAIIAFVDFYFGFSHWDDNKDNNHSVITLINVKS